METIWVAQCGWHIVAQGFHEYVDIMFPDFPIFIIKDHKKIKLNWIYPWMKYCMYLNKFELAKFLSLKIFILLLRKGREIKGSVPNRQT